MPQVRELFLGLSLLLLACGGKASVPASPPSLPRLDVVRMGPGEKVVIDGMLGDRAWKRARSLVVPLTGAGPQDVDLAALSDGRKLFLRAIWRDPTMSLGRYWIHHGADRFELHRGEDSFAICWAPGADDAAFAEQGCALYCHEERHTAPALKRGFSDFWFWGAQQTAAFDQARDLWLPFGKGLALRGDSQPDRSDNVANRSADFTGPAYFPRLLRRNADRFLYEDNIQKVTARQLREKLTRNPEGGRQIPFDIVRPRKGSRGDVAAVARHHAGVGWVLELARDLDTGHRDDLAFDPRASARRLFAIAVGDGVVAADQARSGPIELRFLPPK